MRLCEEYLQRHKIFKLPVVYYCRNACILLKTPDSYEKWMFLCSEWIEHDAQSRFLISSYRPQHDGYKLGNIFSKSFIDAKKWYEYEDFMIYFCKNMENAKPIVDRNQLKIVLWEIFVYVYDSLFANQSFQIKELVYNSLNSESNTEDRIETSNIIIAEIAKTRPAVFRIWQNEFLKKQENYATWMADLFQTNCF